MFSVFRILAGFMALSAVAWASPKALRVCADPNNLPFSNHAQQGFENKLAEMIGADLGMKVEYTWEAERKSFLKRTLLADKCDVVMGIPSAVETVSTTAPYFTSTYVFVSRKSKNSGLHSLDDSALRSERIGVHVIGDDYAALPPAQALAKRGIVRNVVGYSIYGNLDEADPPAELINAVAKNDVDVAIAWGPLAGYFAARSSVPLSVVPICTDVPDRFTPLVFSISMGVRHGDTALLSTLNSVLTRHAGDIHKLLVSYGVPFATAGSRQSCKGGA